MILIGHGNRDHATSYKRGRSEHFTAYFLRPDFDRLLNKAPFFGRGWMISITVSYSLKKSHTLICNKEVDLSADIETYERCGFIAEFWVLFETT